jgi:hypothetical protein
VGRVLIARLRNRLILLLFYFIATWFSMRRDNRNIKHIELVGIVENNGVNI